jgi:hypothetical protein
MVNILREVEYGMDLRLLGEGSFQSLESNNNLIDLFLLPRCTMAAFDRAASYIKVTSVVLNGQAVMMAFNAASTLTFYLLNIVNFIQRDISRSKV